MVQTPLHNRVPVEPTRSATPIFSPIELAISRHGRPGEPLPDADRQWVGRARRIVRARLRHWRAEGVVERAELVVSELVTNAFAHGRGARVGLRLSRAGAVVRVEVGDGTVVTLPGERPRSTYAEGGRGLDLVAACADAWGLTTDQTRVWCELHVPHDGADR